eukprot:14959151-Ditylum_brightwellii.AAC.1
MSGNDGVNALLFLRNKSIVSVGEKKRKSKKIEGIINSPNAHVIVQEVLTMQSMFEHVITSVSSVSAMLKERNEK